MFYIKHIKIVKINYDIKLISHWVTEGQQNQCGSSSTNLNAYTKRLKLKSYDGVLAIILLKTANLTPDQNCLAQAIVFPDNTLDDESGIQATEIKYLQEKHHLR